MATRDELIAQGFQPDDVLTASALQAAGFTPEGEEEEGLSFLEKAQFISPLLGLSALDRAARKAVLGPAKKAATEAFKVGRADKAAGLREGLIPWTPDWLDFVIPGLDSRLKTKAEEMRAEVNPEMQDRVSQQLSEGKLWPVQEGQKWYQIDPALIPEAINTWAASAGDQAATMIQTMLGKLVGGIAGRVGGAAVGGAVGNAPGAVTGATVGGKIGGHIGGAVPNIANETAGFMHDAEFWGIGDKEIMEENARYYGLASGLMEYAQNAVELAAAKGVLKLSNTKAVSALKKNLIVKGLKELGINAGEGLMEVSQDALERFFLRRAAGQMQQADPSFKMPDIPDTFAGWKRTFAQAAGTAAMMRGAGHAISRGVQNVHRQFQKSYAENAGENPLMQEPRGSEFRPEPRVMPQADVEPIDNEQLRIEGEELLPEEQAALEQLEEEFRGQGSSTQDEEGYMIVGGGERGVVEGNVKPRLYIGNVTRRAKNAWAAMLNRVREKEEQHGKEVEPKDLGQHREGPFPTKRTQIEMTVDEARDLERQLTDVIDERLAESKPFDSKELALLKATWGDVKELREALGLPTGRMPFRVIHADKVRIAVVPSTTERVYVGIEGPNKRILADLSHNDLVTQGEAIKAAMKKAAAAAKHAFSVGGKEAQKKLREQVRELKRKARAIRLARIARKRLAKELTRKVSSRIDPYYRQAIQTIVDRVDPTNRSDATQRRIDGLQSAIQQDQTVAERIQNPTDRRLLRKAEQVPLNRISTRQLETLVEERRRLQSEGRYKAKRLRDLHKQQTVGFVSDAVETLKSVSRRDRLAPGRETDNAAWFQKMWDKWRGAKGEAGFGTYRIDRMMEYLDGFKRGFFTHIWEKVKADLHTSRERRSIRVREFVQFMKDTGIDGAQWMMTSLPFRRSDGTVHNLTPWQLIGAYIQSKHPTGKGHLVEGNKFSEGDIRQIARMVEGDQKMTAAYNWIVERQRAQWKALTDRLRAIGVDPTRFKEITEYLPLMIADMDMVEQDDVLHRFLEQFVPQELLPKGFLRERKEGASQSIELDAMLLFMHSIDQVEHVMAMAPILTRLGSLLGNAEFHKALNGVTYGKGTDILTQWLTDIGRDRVVREQAWYDKIVHYLQRNAVLYAIGWNFPSVLKQIPALFVGFAEDSNMVRFLVPNLMSLSSPERFREFRDEVRSKSSVLRHRNIEPELRAMWNKKHLQAMMKKQFGKRSIELDAAATSWMRSTDDWLTTLVWKCRYDAVMDAGLDERTAIRLADSAVQKTQQMASPEDLPHLFRGGTISNIINLFQNQANQELNYWIHDIYGKAAHGRLTAGQVAWRVMMATILPIAVYNVVSHGGKKDDEEDEQSFATGAAGYMLGSLPLVGRVANMVVNGYGGEADLWAMPMEGIEQVASGVRRGDMTTALKGVAKTSTLAPTGGLINSQLIRTVEGMFDLQSGETDDARRLIWSKAMLGEKQEQNTSRKGGIR